MLHLSGVSSFFSVGPGLSDPVDQHVIFVARGLEEGTRPTVSSAVSASSDRGGRDGPRAVGRVGGWAGANSESAAKKRPGFAYNYAL